MLQTAIDQLVEAHRVDEQRSVNSGDRVRLYSVVVEQDSIDTVSRDRCHVLRFENNAWDVEVLCIQQSLIDPRFKHFGAHLIVAALALEPGTLGINLLLIRGFGS